MPASAHATPTGSSGRARCIRGGRGGAFVGRARASGLLLLLGACAGTPIEADTAGGEGSSSGSGGATSSATMSTTSSPGEASAEGSGDPSGDPSGGSSGDPSGGASGDPSAGSSGDPSAGSSGPGDTTDGLSAGSSDGGSSDGGGGSSTTGELGGCLGEPLPEVAPAMCSINSNTEASLDISNTCSYPIEVFWVGYDCDEVSYQVISGGNDWGLLSYETHPWRIRNEQTGELMLEIPPLDGDTVVVVQ